MTYKTKNPTLFSRFFLEVNFDELEKARKKAEETLGPSNEVKVVFLVEDTASGNVIEKLLPNNSTCFTSIAGYRFCHNLTDNIRELRVLLDS